MASADQYRPNVCVVVTDGFGHVLLCERSDNRHDGTLQTVQGGIDPGETVLEAAIRETVEELGVYESDITILDVMEERFSYRWDAEHIARTHSDFVGQEQTFVLAQIEADTPMNLDTHFREFSRVFWGSPEELLSNIWEPKRPGIYAALIRFGLLTERS